MTTFEFTVYGVPVPQGSMKRVPGFAGRDPATNKRILDWSKGRVVHSNEGTLLTWRQECTSVALQARQQIAAIDREIAVAIHLAFYFPRPASLAKRVTRHIRKPDFDKLIRAAADAFTSVLYIDDAQADEAHIYKRYAGGALDPLGSNGTPRMVVKVLAQEDAIAKTPPLFEEKSTSVSPAAPPKRARKPKPVRVEVGF